METDKRDREREITPIMDGDSRPDQVIDPDKEKLRESDKKKDKVSTTRAADNNKLEDFKDAQ